MKLDEREIARSYIGKQYSNEKLNKIAYPNRENEHMCCYIDLKKEYLELFGITPRLYEKWRYFGYDFTVYIYVQGDFIKDCKIFKYRETYGGHGRPCGYELIPTQQEIRIFRRIMDYVICSD
jgi:hypothetical protein